MSRKQIFDAIRAAKGSISPDDAVIIDGALDRIGVPSDGGAHKLTDASAFFSKVRATTGDLDQIQVDTINGLISAAAHWPIGWLAYGLATAWHEARFKPIPEFGKGRGKPYGVRGKYQDEQYGRGLVQLTWDRNYEWADKALGLNGSLLANFDRALEPEIATRILVKGMEEGAFTGKSLSTYIGKRGTVAEFTQARRIINGVDRAQLIAGYAVSFQDSLEAGGWS